jgi:hypothetical protein
LLAPPGSELLDHLLRKNRLLDAAFVLREVAAAHGLGIRFGPLLSWEILICPQEKVVFLGAGRASFGKRGRASALFDLAGLSATIEASALSSSARLKLLRVYLAQTAGTSSANARRRAWSRIVREDRHLRQRGLLPEMLDLVEQNEPGCTGQAIRECSQDLLAWQIDEAVPVRERAGKTNYCLQKGERRYYLKVHRGSASQQGLREWRNNLRVQRIGLPTAAIAGWGERGTTSFFASQDRGGIPLDDLLRSNARGDAAQPDTAKSNTAKPGTARGGASQPRAESCGDPRRDAQSRRTMARDLGRMVARFHRAGFFHRDFYLCHLLMEEGRIVLIDLQRMQDGPLFRRHGQVKDLAALLYSSADTAISVTDRLRFFVAYKGGGRLRAADRKLIVAVARKAARIAAHDKQGGGRQ